MPMPPAPKPQLQWVTIGDTLYRHAVELRFKVLREPLGMPRGSEIYAHESDTLHLVAHEGEKVLGCVLLHPLGDGDSGKLLQMAVSPFWQGRGIGAVLVSALEEKARELKLSRIVLNAREVAFPFYERLGYEYTGGYFEEVGIPHRAMAKPTTEP